MTRIKIETIIWDDNNLEHIKKHSVTKLEVEKAVVNFVYHKKAHSGRYLLVNKIDNRILTVVVQRKKPKTYYVATARDASRIERKKLKQHDKE